MLKQPSAVLVPDFCLCQHSSSDRLTSRVVFFVAVKILSLCLSSRCRPGRQRPFFLITRYSSTWLPVIFVFLRPLSSWLCLSGSKFVLSCLPVLTLSLFFPLLLFPLLL